MAIVCFLVADVGAQAQQGGRFFDSDGVRIHHADRGRGEPVVLIHGFTGSYARHWESPGVIAALTGVSGRRRILEVRARHHQYGFASAAGRLTRR